MEQAAATATTSLPHLLGKSDRGSASSNSAPPSRSSAACWDFQKGKCTRGDRCKFAHVPGVSGATPKMEGHQIEFDMSQF